MELADLAIVTTRIGALNNQLRSEWNAGGDPQLCKNLAMQIEKAAGDLVEVFAALETAIARNTPSTEGDTA